MVVLAVLGLIDPAAFVRFWRLSRLEFWVAVITAASGLVLGLLPAVLVGVLLTLLLVLVELDRVGVTELQHTHDGQDLQAAGAHTEPVPGLLILRFDGPLYTANVRSANRKIITSVDRHPGTEVLVLDATALGELSITVIEEFAELERELGDRGVSLWMAGLPPNALLTARQTPRWAELDQATGSTRPPDRPNGRACVPCPLTADPPQLSVDARSCTSAASRSNPSSRTSPHRRGALARSTARCGFRPPGQVPGAPLGGRQQAPP
jgi:MFS superfamily sulfate permease-like transporter